ncbi:hypothetical protein A3A63_00215 [Candidatus Gottesmanbacteria bacterium RIFCSPLOWO2_01_FULL_46_9]|uniref:Uncharacterized protein n=1 Tax=Candidatus Gottesmanbacteria bacterium RIFCSPLOWO2_01_FULL_46_9 TaxID=1798394 RepID=A0A1F6AX34_9BACT|nr:MAG: hypothetical protein A3A63_00215 [Candidatus Gottesmanbacteria bacterium RIFCSPLOWO2_01_FULL_46_9]
MPKKTRREKLKAERRRLSAPSFISKPASSESNATAPLSTFQFHASNQKKARSAETENAAELVVITRDLSKTLILAVIAITIEVFIYLLHHGK